MIDTHLSEVILLHREVEFKVWGVILFDPHHGVEVLRILHTHTHTVYVMTGDTTSYQWAKKSRRITNELKV